MVPGDEAFHFEALDEEDAHIGQGRSRPLIGGDQAADRHSREIVEPPQRLLKWIAADVSNSPSIPFGTAIFSSSAKFEDLWSTQTS